MEAFALAVGVILMLVAAVGIVFYVALVIAIPVCRFLDWITGADPSERTIGRQASSSGSRSKLSQLSRQFGRAAPNRRSNDKDQ